MTLGLNQQIFVDFGSSSPSPSAGRGAGGLLGTLDLGQAQYAVYYPTPGNNSRESSDAFNTAITYTRTSQSFLFVGEVIPTGNGGQRSLRAAFRSFHIQSRGLDLSVILENVYTTPRVGKIIRIP